VHKKKIVKKSAFCVGHAMETQIYIMALDCVCFLMLICCAVGKNDGADGVLASLALFSILGKFFWSRLFDFRHFVTETRQKGPQNNIERFQ
jgi:hypothetical protein